MYAGKEFAHAGKEFAHAGQENACELFAGSACERNIGHQKYNTAYASQTKPTD